MCETCPPGSPAGPTPTVASASLPTAPTPTAGRSCTSARRSELAPWLGRGWRRAPLQTVATRATLLAGRQGATCTAVPQLQLACACPSFPACPPRRYIEAELARQERRRRQLQEQRLRAVRLVPEPRACRRPLQLPRLPPSCLLPSPRLRTPLPLSPAGRAGAAGAGAPGSAAVPVRAWQPAPQRAPAAAGAAAARGAGAAGGGVAGAHAAVGAGLGLGLDACRAQSNSVLAFAMARAAGRAWPAGNLQPTPAWCAPLSPPGRHKVQHCALQLLEAGFGEREAHAAAGTPPSPCAPAPAGGAWLRRCTEQHGCGTGVADR